MEKLGEKHFGFSVLFFFLDSGPGVLIRATYPVLIYAAAILQSTSASFRTLRDFSSEPTELSYLLGNKRRKTGPLIRRWGTNNMGVKRGVDRV